jgi:undecaprenyl phosphate N,N'-diacetylbacillosamine 1-phosphate transferase
MNQTNFDMKNNNEAQLLRMKLRRYLVGLGAYFAIVLTNIVLVLSVAVIGGDLKVYGIKEMQLSLLPIVGLWIYSAFTTKTINKSFSFRLQHIVKRFFDVTYSSLALIFILPLMVIFALAIKLDSPGPVFYRSRRIGQYGRLIDIFTFRTMPIVPTGIPYTRSGRVLRRISLDELPMLYNVIEGDLSVVGPWPRPYDSTKEVLDKEERILTFRPGMTGLSQISKIPASDIRYRMELDLEYIEKWSLALDLKIILKTMIIGLKRK